MAKKVTMTKGAFVKEHKDLVHVLKSGKGLHREYMEQKKELDKITQ